MHRVSVWICIFALSSENKRGRNDKYCNLLFEISFTALAAAALIGVNATICALSVAVYPHNLCRLATVEASLQV